jgi:hypothetical protein
MLKTYSITTTTSAYLVVLAILTLPLLLRINYPPAPPAASSLATPLTTRGIAALTSPPTASSLVTSSSTKMCFPLQAPPHPPISTPSLSPIRLPLLPRHLALRRCPRHARPRRPHLRTSTRATCGLVDVYRTMHGHTRATCGPVGLYRTTRGHACATPGPVDERHALRRPCPRLPPLWEHHSLSTCGLGLVDEHGPPCQARCRLSPVQDDCARGTRRRLSPARDDCARGTRRLDIPL